MTAVHTQTGYNGGGFSVIASIFAATNQSHTNTRMEFLSRPKWEIPSGVTLPPSWPRRYKCSLSPTSQVQLSSFQSLLSFLVSHHAASTTSSTLILLQNFYYTTYNMARSRTPSASKRAVHPAPAPADAASTSHKNTATDNPATSTTENPALNNPEPAIDDAASTRDENTPTDNPTPAIGVATRDENNPTDNPVTTTTENPTSDAIPTNDLSAARNSPAALSTQNADTALELGDSPMPKHDEDAPFKLDDETTVLAAKAPTKQDDAPLPSSTSSEPAETLNDNVSQGDRSLAETDQVRLARLRGEILKLGWKKRQYRAEVEALEKRMATAGDDGTYYELSNFNGLTTRQIPSLLMNVEAVLVYFVIDLIHCC
jgi:hypothetical protein